MSEKHQILLVAPEPDPQFDPSEITENFLSGRYTHIELHVLRIPAGKRNSGGWLSVLSCLFRIFALKKKLATLQKQTAAVLFVPHHPEEGQGVFDCLLLIALREIFPRLIVALASSVLEEASRTLPGTFQKRFLKACRRTDLFLVPSHGATALSAALEAPATLVAPVGLADPWKDGPRRERNHVPFLLYLGAVTEEAGVGVLIEACKNLKERGYQFRCRISGTPHSNEALAELKRKAADAGDWITFSGPVGSDAKWDLFAESDIYSFLAPSAVEPYGIGVMEAMMCGLPVVVSHAAPSSEFVSEGKSGFVVAAGDVKAASDRLAKLIKDPLLRQIMGNSGRARYVDQFTLEAFHHRWESAILEILKN